MAHGLSFQNGEAEAIYTGRREDVWHALGQYTGVITVDALRRVVGIPVEKLPVRYNRPLGNGDSVETESVKAFLTVRMDTGEELASVGPSYTVVQHDQALVQAIEPIVDAGYATVDAAGLLYQGLAGWSLLKWNLDKMDPLIRQVYGDEIQAYGLCLSWHGEGNANSYANVSVRAVCRNTIDAGMESATLRTKVYHRRNAVARQFDAARETFRHVIAHHKGMAEAYALLQRTTLDKSQWTESVGKVIAPELFETPGPDGKLPAFSGPRGASAEQRVRDRANRVYSLWTRGTGHTGNRSAWEAFNGLVESLDHDTDMWRGRSAENRALSLTDGPLAKVRRSVFASLLQYAQQSAGLAVTA